MGRIGLLDSVSRDFRDLSRRKMYFSAEFKKYLNGLLFTTMTTEGKIRDDYGRAYIDLVTKTKFHKVISTF